MTTHILREGEDLSPACKAILRGEVIAVPTETVYGLVCDAMNTRAIDRIYSLKNRPAIKPLAVLVSGMRDVERLCRNIPDDARSLADRIWPGPLTMVLERGAAVPDLLTAGGDTLGVRCPDNDLTREIIRASAPLAGPSANLSDMPSPTTVQEVLGYFDGQIPIAVDGGVCAYGIESTVLDLTVSPYRVVRRGALTKRRIRDIVGSTPSGVTVIGITGGTGSGKTTSLSALSSLGATVIDCDAVYHSLLGDESMLAELDARFPGVVADGVLDRAALREIVFSDSDELAALNKITHKYVDREVMRTIRGLEAAGGSPVVAVDAIALIESGLAARCDYVAAVTAPVETRAARIMARDNISEADALRRIDAQPTEAFYKERCDIALSNNQSEAEFSRLCAEHFSKVLEEYL